MVVMWAGWLAARTAGCWAAMMVDKWVVGMVVYSVEKSVACLVVQLVYRTAEMMVEMLAVLKVVKTVATWEI